jgi:hypothetical protein
MSSSLLVREVLLSLALFFLAVPAAFANDPGATTTTETTTTESTATETTRAPDPWAETPQTLRLRARGLRYRAAARRWRTLMGKQSPHIYPPAVPFESLLARRQWWARAWRTQVWRTRYAGRRPPHRLAWLCIHGYEGPWRDPNPPYFGGLQMDLTFQRMYGLHLLRRKGTADHWTRFEQMWVAERAHHSGRGFYPWPVTARRCGLI